MAARDKDDRDAMVAALKTKLGEATLANELLEQKIAILEAGRPLARRRPRR